MKNVRHPDTIPGLAPDCRRILRDEYMSIQVAAQRPKFREENFLDHFNGRWVTEKIDQSRENAVAIAEAIAEYKRVAEMWDVTL